MSRHTPEGAGAASWAILAVILALFALAYLVLGCGTLGGTSKPSAEKTWKAALTTYEALATGMEVYCGLEPAEPVPCIKAATASLRAEKVIDATKDSLASGHATEAILEASAAALRAIEPTLRAVQPPGQE